MSDASQRRDEICEYIQQIHTLNPTIIDFDYLSQKYQVSKSAIQRDISVISKKINFKEPDVGIITKTKTTIDGELTEELWIKYQSIGKNKLVSLLFFPNKQIATITESHEDEHTGDIKYSIIAKGMNKQDIEHYFPARITEQKRYGSKYNLQMLIRSIIYEAYIREGLPGTIDGGTVRHFWYTHLKPLLVGNLGLTENDSLIGAMNESWKAVIKSGAVTYEGMDIVGGKESGRISIVKDSPFNNIIIAVEKQNFFETFKWIPQLFNCTLITAGGTPSRAVTRKFIHELKELHVNLDQDFHMCVASDLDPAGYNIQHAFCDQLESAIKHYGGTGKITIHRLFVRKDQVTDSLLESQAIPWRPDTRGKNTKKHLDMLKKMNDTIWKRFCERTDGGLYIPKPEGWNASNVFHEDTLTIDEQPMVRALLEMDAFSTKIIEKSLVKELLKIIRETSDETKIMIPEIMRVFESVRSDVIADVFESWKQELIEPLKQQFLSDTKEWNDFIYDTKRNDRNSIIDEYDDKIEDKENEKREREPELFDEQEECAEILDALKKERDEKIKEIEEDYKDQLRCTEFELEDVNELIDEKCEDLDTDIANLEDERNEELERIDEEFDFRLEQYNQFREEHLAVFNPVEQALKNDIALRLSDEQLPYRFTDLETHESTKRFIAKLLTHSELLLDKNTSCFYHPAPSFKGGNYLQEASENKDLNIGNVRDAFPDGFLKAMGEMIQKDASQISFELSKSVEMKDLSQEVHDAMNKTEDNLAEEMDGDDHE